MISALQHELESPSVAAFIDAVDVTLNSNTYVMRLALDHAVAVGDHAGAFERVVRSEQFRELMYVGDAGYWDNYHTIDVVDGDIHYTRRQGEFLAPDFAIECRALTNYAFVDRLVWLLSTRRGSWHRPMPVTHARMVVARLLAALFGDMDPTLIRGCDRRKNLAALIPPGAALFRVAPSFLNSTGYFDPDSWAKGDDEDPGPTGLLPYFDGGIDDTCTVVFQGTTCTVVLTNGSP